MNFILLKNHTLVLVVCLSGTAFAILNDDAVAVNGSQAASDDGVNVDASEEPRLLPIGAQSATTGGKNTAVDVDVDTDVQGNAVATKGAQAATNGGRNLNVEDALNNNKVAFNGGQIAGRDTNPDNRTYNVVDNAILANVNVAGGAPVAYTPSNGAMTFTKSQTAEISGSFNELRREQHQLRGRQLEQPESCYLDRRRFLGQQPSVKKVTSY